MATRRPVGREEKSGEGDAEQSGLESTDDDDEIL
jgi:hypothetical protein